MGDSSNAHTVPEGWAASSALYYLEPFFFLFPQIKEFRNNAEQLSRLRALDSKTASACVPFPDQNINQEGKGEHMGCL